MKNSEVKVIKEALRWFRTMLREDALEPHHERLFQAIADLRLEHQTVKLPEDPKLPLDLEFVAPPTLRDSIPEELDAEFLSTIPVPPDTQDTLIIESILEGIGSYKSRPRSDPT